MTEANQFLAGAQRFLMAALQPNDTSRMHKLREAADAGLVFDEDTESAHMSFDLGALIGGAAVFVVKHNWAAALGDALQDSDDIRLPYDVCAFEFRLENTTAIAFAEQAGSDIQWRVLWLYPGQARSVWRTGVKSKLGAELQALLVRQVRAICVALDARVAEEQLVHSPAALNKKRLRRGQPPLSDYHVVDLARRLRPQAELPGAGHAPKVRLHFRRGHWRHLDETRRTWINWTLVGNPELGWIDKEYRI